MKKLSILSLVVASIISTSALAADGLLGQPGTYPTNSATDYDVLQDQSNQAIATIANSALDKAQVNSQSIQAIQQQAASGAFKGDKGDTGATGATGAQGLQGVAGANGKDGLDGKDGLNGKNGSNGKDGVTTTITKKEVDTQTINTVKKLNAQTTAQAKDLNDAKQFFAQQHASSNAQFKSLKSEVDSNKKEARSGAASAIAIASMPQVEANQSVMFSAGVGQFKDESAVSVGGSFHAGNAVVKAGVSASTNDDFSMGAGIGFGF